MRILKVLIWSGLCVAAGVALASVRVDGHTPWERLQKGVKQQGPALDKAKGTVSDVYDEAKKKLSRSDDAPTEQHSDEDKEAINRLVAHRK